MDIKRSVALVGLAVAATGCGGGGGGSGTIDGGAGSNGWTQGVYLPSDSFKNQCAAPRTGTNSRGQPFPDRPGSVLTENNWLRSWTNELYLWYDEVPDRNPATFPDPETYFSLLKTTATTPSGAAKDKFHFTWNTAEWESFSQSGVVASGYGATFEIINRTPPREVAVVLVEPNSPASRAGLLRGDRIVTIDGVDVANGSDTNRLNAGLFPEADNETHTFRFSRSGGAPTNITMQSANVASTPVHTVDVIDTPTGPVGYILFNDHIATAEDGLFNAISTLRDANIVDLVLDVRYNGGGYLAIASQLAYMIAGSSRTAGRDFERTVWNNKHPATNPVTGQALAPMPFVNQTVGLGSRPTGTTLPTLNLPQPRVYVLTSADTCSASEAIMNSLRGIDMEVIQIGTTTCGKPYGFYDFDNCGTTYFSVQFKGVNAKGFGDYTDGFSPAATQTRDDQVPGCEVADDIDYQLGHPTEPLLSVALAYRTNGACPTATLGQNKLSGTVEDAVIARPPYRKIRVMRAEDFAP
jgi:hypothetical protein